MDMLCVLPIAQDGKGKGSDAEKDIEEIYTNTEKERSDGLVGDPLNLEKCRPKVKGKMVAGRQDQLWHS